MKAEVPVEKDHVSILRQLACLMACQPCADADEQAGQVLQTLLEILEADAVGLYWVQRDNGLLPRLQLPAEFNLADPLRQILTNRTWLDEMMAGQAGDRVWLAVPTRTGSVPVGRLWVVRPAEQTFSSEERELLLLVGHQLAAAQENLRLYREVTRLAERRGALLRRIINAQDERCRRVSRELHDEISPSLAALKIDLETALAAHPEAAQAIRPHLERVRAGMERTMDEVSRIVLDLRPALLEDHGLVAALRWYGTERLRDSNVNFHVNAACAPRLPDHLETTVYRIAQEAITNVVHHATARNLWLEIACPDHSFALTVRDDGCGFDVETILAQPTGMQGIGLFGMKERAALVGGELTVQSTPGRGTSIQITLPLKGQAGNGQNQNPVGR